MVGLVEWRGRGSTQEELDNEHNTKHAAYQSQAQERVWPRRTSSDHGAQLGGESKEADRGQAAVTSESRQLQSLPLPPWAQGRAALSSPLQSVGP